jgi:antirestriction protein ArdC
MNREEATQVSEETIDQLGRALEQGKSEVMVNYLTMVSKFHDYSFRNCLLIAIQRPDATHVAGFNRWKELRRFVKKGEKGIAILAPLVYRKKQDDSDADDVAADEVELVLHGFKVVHVFDVSQTEGAELPEFASPNGDPGEKLSQLEQLVRRQGITLHYDVILFGADGMSRGGEITVRPDLTPAKTFAVLVHELAHELLHKGERKKEVGKTVKETEAEAVAFVVCKAIGLDPGSSSSDYIQLYAGDKEVLLQSLDYIQKTASFILTSLAGPPLTEEVPHAA